MEKAIVTGATEYIGSNLVKRLLDMNMEVHIITDLDSKSDFNIKDRLHIFEYNNSTSDIVNYFKEVKADIVFHLAALCIDEHKSEDIHNLIESNIKFGTDILEAMAKSGTKRIINTGTYWQNYIDKDYNPVCLYAATKEAFEKIIEYYVEAENFSAVTLKLFDTYGYNDARNKILNIFKKISNTGESIDMSSGEQFMDLVYIDDIVQSFISAANLTEEYTAQHRKYFVKTGHTIKLKDLANLYETTFNTKLNINWGAKEYRKREVMKPYEDGETLPNWKATLNIEDGLKLMSNLEQNIISGNIDFELKSIENLIQLKNTDEACSKYIKLIESLDKDNEYIAKVYKSFAEFLFNCSCYEESLDMFITAHDLNYMKDDIENFIYKMFLEPNLDSFKKSYIKNLMQCENGKSLLKQYPFESLPLQLVPTLQDKYYVFDRLNHKFRDKYKIIEYKNISYLENKFIQDEFSDIVIYEDWNYENIRQYLRIYMGGSRKLYVVSDNLSEMLSFLQFSDIYNPELKDIRLFSSTEEFKKFFEADNSIYMPLNIISESESKKEELNSIISEIHKNRIKKYRDKSNILLTICIPSYNRGHRALLSVEELLKLKYDSEIEILVSNNASTENTDGYRQIQSIEDSRISYYELETSQGLSGNVYNAVKHAKGKFLLLISDEDMVVNLKLPYYMKKLKNNPKAAIVATRTVQSQYRKNAYYKKGNEAILNFMLTNNHMSGTIYNNELIKKNSLDLWMNQKQIENNNQAFLLYPHEFLDIALANLGDIVIDEMNFILQGKPEKSNMTVDNPNEAIDSKLNIPLYSMYESRLKEMDGWCRLAKELASKNSILIRNMFLKICNKIFFLVSIVKEPYMKNGYNWNEICNIIYKNCLNNMEILYKNIPVATKMNDKKNIDSIKNSYIDK